MEKAQGRIRMWSLSYSLVLLTIWGEVFTMVVSDMLKKRVFESKAACDEFANAATPSLKMLVARGYVKLPVEYAQIKGVLFRAPCVPWQGM